MRGAGHLRVGGDAALEAWIRPAAGAGEGMVLSLGARDQAVRQLVYYGNGEVLGRTAHGAGRGSHAAWSGGAATPDAWHHVVFVAASGPNGPATELRLYVDGALRDPPPARLRGE